MPQHSPSLFFWLALSGLFYTGCTSDSGSLLVGSPCISGAQCTTGQCEPDRTSTTVCTQSCVSDVGCPGDLFCLSGFCHSGCRDGETMGTGASRQLCVDAEFRACAELDDVAQCDVCGCEAFGGGVCLDGMGCTILVDAGGSCTVDAVCADGVCYQDTSTCGAPRAIGEPCIADAECASSNCGADGSGVAGVCNQELGSSCGLTVRGRTDTCSRCIPAQFGDSICSRDSCDPENTNSCIVGGARRWECARRTDGTHGCFETCTDARYFCFDPSDICRNGFCS